MWRARGSRGRGVAEGMALQPRGGSDKKGAGATEELCLGLEEIESHERAYLLFLFPSVLFVLSSICSGTIRSASFCQKPVICLKTIIFHHLIFPFLG